MDIILVFLIPDLLGRDLRPGQLRRAARHVACERWWIRVLPARRGQLLLPAARGRALRLRRQSGGRAAQQRGGEAGHGDVRRRRRPVRHSVRLRARVPRHVPVRGAAAPARQQKAAIIGQFVQGQARRSK